MNLYRKNHYVPVWFQNRFFPEELREKKFYYLDLRPDSVISNGYKYRRNDIRRLGPPNCFSQNDLYTTFFGAWYSTEIERKFFGPIDSTARDAVDFFCQFTHRSIDGEKFKIFLRYLSLQKLRTPKGLMSLSNFTRQTDRNKLLFEMQRLQQIYCAIWTESVWCIMSAAGSPTKFILSDHPVIIYNQGCYPGSKWCRDWSDPDIRMHGSHTLVPLSYDTILVLTNLSWARNPYQNSRKQRPNPNFFRSAIFSFQDIQIGRELTEEEVLYINYVVKKRAFRYIASPEKEWLYPEASIGNPNWKKIGQSLLFMPDPRSMIFSRDIIIGYDERRADAFDEYGRKPWQADYNEESRAEKEWQAFHAFQGEYARRFGPVRRGLSMRHGRLEQGVDDDEYHKYHLDLESKYRKPNAMRRNVLRS